MKQNEDGVVLERQYAAASLTARLSVESYEYKYNMLLLVGKTRRMARVWTTVRIWIKGRDVLRLKLHKKRPRLYGDWRGYISHWGL